MVSNDQTRLPNGPMRIKIHVVVTSQRNTLRPTKPNCIISSLYKYTESSRRVCSSMLTGRERIGKGISPFNLYTFQWNISYEEKA